jgi:hypothetical protein
MNTEKTESISGELMDGDGNAIGSGESFAEIRDGRLIVRGDIGMLIRAHIDADGESEPDGENVAMSFALSDLFGALGVPVTFQTDLDGDEYVCTCDDSSACAACYDAAALYIGAVIEDRHGRIWIVRETDQKDDWPTLDGDQFWAPYFPDELTVITRDAEQIDGLAACDNGRHVHKLDELRDVERLAERIDPGGMVPAGECPDCGALAYPLASLVH